MSNKKKHNKVIRHNHQINGDDAIKKGEVKPNFNLEDGDMIGGLTTPKKDEQKREETTKTSIHRIDGEEEGEGVGTR